MKPKIIFQYCLTSLLVLSLLTGCGGLPSDIKRACKNLSARIETGKQTIEQNHESYADHIKQDKYNKVRSAFTKENLENIFNEANKDLDRAGTLYIANVKPLLDENKEELAAKVLVELKRINAIIIDAENKSRNPLKRAKHVYDIFLTADSVYKKSVPKSENTTKTVKDIQSDTLMKAKDDFPDKAKKIDAKFAPLILMAKQSEDALKKLGIEYDNHKKNNNTDYSALVEASDLIDDNYRNIQVLKKKFSIDIESLSKSYTKILRDMKPIHSVVIKRESWNNNQDFSTPGNVSFVRNVSPEVYEFIENNQIETIAELYPGWNNLKMKNHIGSNWTKLKIDPVEKWPRQGRHDSAVFWFDSWSTTYLHKYTIIENGKKHDTSWKPVSEEVYEKNFEYLGMAILTKPFGMFEDEADTNATPPGMGFVGNPEYGKWEKDGSGNSFWSWYGKYALFSNLLFYSTMGPMRYNSWNRYNTNYRGRKPFFGSTAGGAAKYGTHGTYTKQSSRFRNTSFAQTGGFKRPAPSVRGAASSVRGGGPKSKGK
jgi:hypothetical protein